jgi:uncharacterized pyridoxal phosphate-dependent enzyme
MGFHLKWTRRSFMGILGSLTGAVLNPRGALSFPAPTNAAPDKITGFGSTGNVYEELGVTTVINGQGTMTVLGGSLMRPEVETVMALAAQHFVSIPDLEVAAGKRIAEMLKLPSGYSAMVTSGAAAAMQSGLAGILTGNNPKFIEQIPDLTGMKSEVIIQKSHRNPFDHQLRNTGVKLVVIETGEELRKAVNEKTAMMHFSNFANAQGQIKVDEWVKLARELNIPAMIDAAADTPPVSHLWDYANMGYDLICYSGGKAIRGPQCAGLLLGKQELVANALLNNSPHEDTIGRSQKVGKEEIVGMIKALELYLAEDQDALNKEWQGRLERISAKVTALPGVATSYFVPDIANHVPHMEIKWDRERIKISAEETVKTLRSGKPCVVLARAEKHAFGEKRDDSLTISSFMLQPGEDAIIANKLYDLLKAHSA